MDQRHIDVDDSRLLKYLGGHLTGSRSGLQQFKAAVETWADTPHEQRMASLVQQVKADQDDLRRIMDALGYEEPALGKLVAPVALLAGRLNPFNPLRGRTFSLAQVQLDVLVGLLNAKLRMWRTLQHVVPSEPRLDDALLVDLCQRAESQIRQLTSISDESWPERFAKTS